MNDGKMANGREEWRRKEWKKRERKSEQRKKEYRSIFTIFRFEKVIRIGSFIQWNIRCCFVIRENPKEAWFCFGETIFCRSFENFRIASFCEIRTGMRISQMTLITFPKAMSNFFSFQFSLPIRFFCLFFFFSRCAARTKDKKFIELWPIRNRQILKANPPKHTENEKTRYI